MDGFKNSTKTQYMKGGPVKRAEAKMAKVMGEFASGKLHSGSKKGPEVTNKKQAVAIAMSEARKAAAKKPVKMREGGVFNERGKRATMAELAAEERRMVGRPVEGVSSRPTDSSGRRMTNEELGMTPGGVDLAKKMPKGVGAMSDREMQMLKEATKKRPKVMSDLERARMMVRPLARKEGGGVPSYSDRPMIRRKTGGLTAMPKGKC